MRHPHAALGPMFSLLLALAFDPGPPALAAQTRGEIRWSDFTLEVGDTEVSAQVGRLDVPERHGAGTGSLELAFVRLASRAADPGPPIVYLDGGPGDSGYGLAQVPDYHRLFDALRDESDVILLSQRGVGLSRPRLVCRRSSPVPDDALTTRERALAMLRPEMEQCAARFRDQGVDLGAYNTRESADDVDAVRRALGVDSVSLLGFSYGTHLGLSVLRRHGHHVSRAVLIGTEGPNHSLKLPSTGDRQLQHLASLAAADPAVADDVPDLYAAVDTLLQRLDAEPVTLDIGPRTIALGGDGMRYLLRRDLGDTNDHPLWPAIIRMTLDGEYELVSRLASRRLNELDGVGLMSTLVDCASGVSPERMARIRAERRTALLGDMMDSWYPEICSALPEAGLDDDFRRAFVSHVPTLFLAGTLDANTPPWQAYEVSWGWPHATVLVVERAGHEALMPWRPAQEVIVDFFRGEDVGKRTLELPAMEFVSVEEERAAQHLLATLRRGLLRLLVQTALDDGHVAQEERAAVAQEQRDLLGQQLDDDDLDAAIQSATEDGRPVADVARELAPHATDAQKAILLQATRRVAEADGDYTSGELDLLTRIGAGLGMSADAIRDVTGAPPVESSARQ